MTSDSLNNMFAHNKLTTSCIACPPPRTSHRQARSSRDRAAAHAGRPQGTGLVRPAAARQRGRRGHHLQPRAQDGQHLLHQHRLRPVRKEPLPRPAHQHDKEQPGHVHTGPGQGLISACCFSSHAFFVVAHIRYFHPFKFMICFEFPFLFQVRFVKNVTEWREMKPAFYHGHVSFLDFTK